MRAIDWWINANAITLLATTVSMTLAYRWLAANRLAARVESGRVLGVVRINMMIARLWLGLNAAVFLLGLALIETARDIDRNASAAHPARIPGFVVWGTIAFTCIWVAACAGVVWLRRMLDQIAATEDEARPLRVIPPGVRRTGGD